MNTETPLGCIRNQFLHDACHYLVEVCAPEELAVFDITWEEYVIPCWNRGLVSFALPDPTLKKQTSIWEAGALGEEDEVLSDACKIIGTALITLGDALNENILTDEGFAALFEKNCRKNQLTDARCQKLKGAISGFVSRLQLNDAPRIPTKALDQDGAHPFVEFSSEPGAWHAARFQYLCEDERAMEASIGDIPFRLIVDELSDILVFIEQKRTKVHEYEVTLTKLSPAERYLLGYFLCELRNTGKLHYSTIWNGVLQNSGAPSKKQLNSVYAVKSRLNSRIGKFLDVFIPEERKSGAFYAITMIMPYVWRRIGCSTTLLLPESDERFYKTLFKSRRLERP